MRKMCLGMFVIGLLATVTCTAQVTFTQFSVGGPVGITAGPDGNLWFAEGYISGDHIGRMTTAGVVTLFSVPSGSAEGGITVGPDGNLWFTEYRTNKIGRVSTTGVFAEFVIPGYAYPGYITAGPDGNLWFTVGYGDAKIGRITPTGVIAEFPVPGGNQIYITPGPDGNLWFTEGAGNQIGRITPAGVITEFPIPTSGAFPIGITAGPDGNLWFTEQTGKMIGRITTSGVITEFPVPAGDTGPTWINVGPDGNLWFDENGYQIGRITTAGVITEFPAPVVGSGLLTLGPDGNLWFTDYYGNQIVKVSIGPRYSACLLYDPTRAVHSGATIPIKLQLCDSHGDDVSSVSIVLHATSVTKVSANINGQVEDSGNANPDNDFRFDATLGSTGGYVYNLKTTGLTTGSYSLNFSVSGDSSVYSAPFQVK